MRVSKSNKVCGYVKAMQRLAKLELRLAERERELLPLRRDVTEAKAEAMQRHQSMTGGQIGEASRILRETIGEPD